VHGLKFRLFYAFPQDKHIPGFTGVGDITSKIHVDIFSKKRHNKLMMRQNNGLTDNINASSSDKTRQDKTRQDKTRQDKTRQDKTFSS